jgi:exodeoxyribonuclease VII large subunit
MPTDTDTVLTVSQLTREIRSLLEEQIGEVWVEGEVSNLRIQSSGHQYFTLKDAECQLSCVMFRGNAVRSGVRLKDGAQVQAHGQVSVYAARGQYQMVVRSVQAKGQGALQARFEALKRRLFEEGLFDQEIKKAIPKYPMTVALVTSPTGAAVQDMLNILTRRAPWIRVLVYPVRVQGQGAEKEIEAAIGALNQADELGLPVPDVLVVGRGGGSLEDLWNFNEECVARAIHASVIPVISAVGHEIDFTIADFAADLRAPTPSAAAEILAPDAEELKRHFEGTGRRLRSRANSIIEHQAQVLELMMRGALQTRPQRLLDEAEQRLDDGERMLPECIRSRLRDWSDMLVESQQALARYHPVKVLAEAGHRTELNSHRLGQAIQHRMERLRDRLQAKGDALRTLGPEGILARGFSFTMDSSGTVITDADQVKVGEEIKTRLAKGTLTSRVNEKG